MACTSYLRSWTRAISPSANTSWILKGRINMPDKDTTKQQQDNDEKQKQTNPGVVDHSSTPPGLMRKSLQAWVMAGLAGLLMLLLWLTGSNKGSTTATQGHATENKTVQGMAPDDLDRRLQEQQQHATAPAATNVTANGQTTSAGATEATTQAPPEDPVAADLKKRNYTSLFSSSVALSYREPANKPPGVAQSTPAPTTELTPEQLEAAIANLGIPPGNPSIPAIPAQPQAQPTPQHLPALNPNLAIGKDYTVFEGTLLEAVLVNRLDGDFSGPVMCMLTNDVYSKDRLHLLIPAGSKLLGETKQVDSFGQRRLAVSFHRLIMPDGYSLDLDRFQGLNQIGETGLKDQVNHHYMQIFGASIAIGAISGLTQLGTANAGIGVPQSPVDTYRQGVGASLAQSSLHILDTFLNVLPTITIREGHRVKVYLTQDLQAPDYNLHAMAPNL